LVSVESFSNDNQSAGGYPCPWKGDSRLSTFIPAGTWNFSAGTGPTFTFDTSTFLDDHAQRLHLAADWFLVG